MQKKRANQYATPQNPIFALLTAPMRFVKHFHELNKGVNPVMTSLPKLVYTTKKYFRDFGKNFHKNCLNLASEIIGDFDQVQPNVIQTFVEPNRRRYRRNISKIKGLVDVKETNNIQKEYKDIELKKENSTQNNGGSEENKSEKKSCGFDVKEVTKPVEPYYSLVFENSKENQNFRKVPEAHVRKKRYVLNIVNDDVIQDQVTDYLAEQLQSNHEYLQPLQEYYNRVEDFLDKIHSGHNPLCEPNSECFSHTSAYSNDEHFEQDNLESFENSEEKPKKKKIINN